MPKAENVPEQEVQAEVEDFNELEADEDARNLVDQLARRHESRTAEQGNGSGSEESGDANSMAEMPEGLRRQLELLQKQNEFLQEQLSKLSGGSQDDDDDIEEDYEYNVELPESFSDIAPALKDLGVHVNGRLKPVEKMVKQLQDGFSQWKSEFDIWRFGQEHPDWGKYKPQIQSLAARHPQLLDSYDGLESLLKLAKADTEGKELETLRAERKRESAVLGRMRPARTVAKETDRKAKTLNEALEIAAARMRREGLI